MLRTDAHCILYRQVFPSNRYNINVIFKIKLKGERSVNTTVSHSQFYLTSHDGQLKQVMDEINKGWVNWKVRFEMTPLIMNITNMYHFVHMFLMSFDKNNQISLLFLNNQIILYVFGLSDGYLIINIIQCSSYAFVLTMFCTSLSSSITHARKLISSAQITSPSLQRWKEYI